MSFRKFKNQNDKKRPRRTKSSLIKLVKRPRFHKGLGVVYEVEDL